MKSDLSVNAFKSMLKFLLLSHTFDKGPLNNFKSFFLDLILET